LIGAYTELLRLMRMVGVPDTALLRMPLELRYADGFLLKGAMACCSREEYRYEKTDRHSLYAFPEKAFLQNQ
jgi:hypothetical protein